MATVRFSDALKSTIRSKARQLFRDKLAKLQEPLDHWAKEPAAVYYGWATNFTKNVPPQFFKTTEKLSVSKIVTPDYTYRTHGATAIFPAAAPVPVGTLTEEDLVGTGIKSIESSYYGGSINVALDGTDPRWASILQEVRERETEFRQTEAQQDGFLKGVDAIINGYSTLAPALKEWPPLWDLLDSDAQERHKRIVERNKPAVPVNEDGEAVDLDSMTAAVAVAKMRGSV